MHRPFLSLQRGVEILQLITYIAVVRARPSERPRMAVLEACVESVAGNPILTARIGAGDTP